MMANVNIEFTLRNGSKHTISHRVDKEQCRLNLNSLKNSIIRVHEESNDFITSIVNDEKAQSSQCKFTEESQDNDGVSEEDSSEESDDTDEVIVEGKPPPLKKMKSYT